MGLSFEGDLLESISVAKVGSFERTKLEIVFDLSLRSAGDLHQAEIVSYACEKVDLVAGALNFSNDQLFHLGFYIKAGQIGASVGYNNQAVFSVSRNRGDHCANPEDVAQANG